MVPCHAVQHDLAQQVALPSSGGCCCYGTLHVTQHTAWTQIAIPWVLLKEIPFQAVEQDLAQQVALTCNSGYCCYGALHMTQHTVWAH